MHFDHVRSSITGVVLFCILIISNNSYAAYMYVVNRGNNTITKYDAQNGEYTGISTSEGLSTPRSIAFGPDNNLYVVNTSGNNVTKYDPDTLKFMGVFASTNLSYPLGLTFGPDNNLYVSKWQSGQGILKFDGATGAYIGEFTTSNINAVNAVTFGPDGNLYAANDDGHTITYFNGTTGQYLGIFAAGYDTIWSDPSDIEFDSQGNAYIASWPSRHNVVAKHDSNGNYIEDFATASIPRGIKFGPDGNLYITNSGNNTITYYDGITGDFLGIFANENLSSPYDLVFTPSTATIPEPTSILLLALGVFRLRKMRRI